jgi:uncharacterized membrane protein
MVMTVILVMIAVVAALGAIGIWLGASNRAVFYSSGQDVFVSLVSLYAVLITITLLNRGYLGNQNVRIMAACAVIGLATLYNYAKSFQCNGLFYGTCVFFGRFLMPIVAIFAIPNLFAKDKDGRTDAVSTMVSLGIAVGVVALIRRLINGDEILNEKDWGENEGI